MFDQFFPDEDADSTYQIDFEKLYRQGYRGILFDIDNTLVPHGEKADERAMALFEKLKKTGYRCCLISNNKKERVEMFNQDIQVNFIEDAHKPSRKNYIRAMQILGTDTKNTVFIGDQLFTDIYGSKESWNQYYFSKTDSSERRNPDCAETVSGKNRASLLQKKERKKKMNHIILIGFMGSGKTSVGKACRHAELSSADDEHIEKTSGMKIADIFEKYGKYIFVNWRTLKNLLKDEERKVISVGGGLPVQERNQPYLKKSWGTVVFLEASEKTLIERLEGDTTRPMLKRRRPERKNSYVDGTEKNSI